MTIHEAIVAVMRELDPIGKADENVQQKYKYRSIEAIYNGIQPLMAKHGIYSTTEVLEQTREERKTAKGGVLVYSILKVKYIFTAEDGSSVECIVIGEGMDAGDKASNKAMSAAHKYAICQLLQIPFALDDPDTHGHVLADTWRMTAGKFNSLKKRWHKPRVKDLAGVAKEEMAGLFAEWVHGTAGRQFDVNDLVAWNETDYDRCNIVLKENEQDAKTSTTAG